MDLQLGFPISFHANNHSPGLKTEDQEGPFKTAGPEIFFLGSIETILNFSVTTNGVFGARQFTANQSLFCRFWKIYQHSKSPSFQGFGVHRLLCPHIIFYHLQKVILIFYSVLVIAPKLAEHQVQGVFSKQSNFHTKLPVSLPFDLLGCFFQIQTMQDKPVITRIVRMLLWFCL